MYSPYNIYWFAGDPVYILERADCISSHKQLKRYTRYSHNNEYWRPLFKVVRLEGLRIIAVEEVQQIDPQL